MKRPPFFHTHLGFSTIEMMIVIGIFVIASVATLPLLSLFNERQTIAALSSELLQTLRRAQSRSLSGTLGKQWGVHIDADGYMLYTSGGIAGNGPEETHAVGPPFQLCTNIAGGDILFPQSPVQPNTSAFIRLYSMEENGEERFFLIDTNGSIHVEGAYVATCVSM